MSQRTRLLILILIILAVSAPSVAQRHLRSTRRMLPAQLVADLYRQHKQESPFFQHKSRSLIDRYFDKKLADLLWNMPSSPGEVGPLDGDPLYNAQDMEIRNFVIHPATSGKESATVLVTFTNLGKKEEIKFLLASSQSGWKITNIKYDDGTDLIGILTSTQ